MNKQVVKKLIVSGVFIVVILCTVIGVLAGVKSNAKKYLKLPITTLEETIDLSSPDITVLNQNRIYFTKQGNAYSISGMDGIMTPIFAYKGNRIEFSYEYSIFPEEDKDGNFTMLITSTDSHVVGTKEIKIYPEKKIYQPQIILLSCVYTAVIVLGIVAIAFLEYIWSFVSRMARRFARFLKSVFDKNKNITAIKEVKYLIKTHPKEVYIEGDGYREAVKKRLESNKKNATAIYLYHKLRFADDTHLIFSDIPLLQRIGIILTAIFVALWLIIGTIVSLSPAMGSEFCLVFLVPAILGVVFIIKGEDK